MGMRATGKQLHMSRLMFGFSWTLSSVGLESQARFGSSPVIQGINDSVFSGKELQRLQK